MKMMTTTIKKMKSKDAKRNRINMIRRKMRTMMMMVTNRLMTNTKEISIKRKKDANTRKGMMTMTITGRLEEETKLVSSRENWETAEGTHLIRRRRRSWTRRRTGR